MIIYQVYKFTNLVNGKVYIGVTQTPIEDRAYAHYRSAEKGSKFAFHCAIRKYGKENFSLEIIYQTLDKDHMFDMERYFIKEHNSCRLDKDSHGYNMTRGGEGYDSETASALIRKRTLEGTNPWAGELGSKHSKELQARLKVEGRHNVQNPEWVAARAQEVRDRVAAGTHHWCGEDWGKTVSERNRLLAEEGKHPFQTDSHKEMMSAIRKELHQCHHCKKSVTLLNLGKWHNDNCKLSPKYDPHKRDEEKKRAAETRKENDKGVSKITCPYCGVIGSPRGPNMSRYHFDKCKHKK